MIGVASYEQSEMAGVKELRQMHFSLHTSRFTLLVIIFKKSCVFFDFCLFYCNFAVNFLKTK